MQRQSVGRHCPQILLILLLSLFVYSAQAQQLPPVTGAKYDGERIAWDSILDADGYNIYLEFEYVDTVVGSTSYVPLELGEYRIAAFDYNGNFSPLQVISAGVVPTTNIAEVSSLPGGVIVEKPSTEDAEQLPPVTGADFDGSVITWDELAGASGYNVYLLAGYIDTVREGTSYTPEASGRYHIVGFDDNGRFSPRQVIDAGGFQTIESVTVDLGNSPTADRPAIPENVSLSVYSDTTAELFWDRPSIDENIVSTEISRDGVLLGTSPGISYVDTARTLRPSTAHRYELVAINANGERSLPAIVNPGALDGDLEEDVLSLMRGISEVTNDNPHLNWFSTLRSLTRESNPLTLLSTERVRNDDDILVVRNTYTCEASDPGTLTIDEIDSRFGIHVLDFDSCTINGTSFFGGVSIVGTDIGGYNAIYADLEIADVEISYLNGLVSLSIGRAINFMTLSYVDFDYYIMGNPLNDFEDEIDTSVVMNQVVLDSIFGDVRSTLTAAFTVSAPWTRGDVVEVATTEQLAGANLGEGNYLTGELSVLSTTGDSVAVTADTGDSLTWSAVVTTADDEFSFSGSWAESGKLPCLSVARDDAVLSGCAVR